MQLLKPDIFDILNAALSNINYPSITVILIGLIIYMVQSTEKRQDKSNARYDKLEQKLIETTKALTENHVQSLKSLQDNHESSIRLLKESNDVLLRDILKELGDIKNELKVCGVKIDETNRLWIFNQGRR